MLSLKNFIKKLCLDRNNVEPEPVPEPDLVDYEVINDLKDTECIICLGPFKSGEHATLVKCGHMYHTTCLYKWFVKKKTCPICDITVDL